MKAFLVVLVLLNSCCVGTALKSVTNPVKAENQSLSKEVLLRFETSVDSESVTPFINLLKSLDFMELEKLPEVIVIEWDSPGGEVEAGFDLSKAIERSPVPVVCIVDGDAASMAFYILQSCDARFATPRSMLMIHSVSIQGNVNGPSAGQLKNLIDVYNKALLGHIAARLKVSKEEVANRIAHGEWWMDAEEALAIGAIDGIVPVSALP